MARELTGVQINDDQVHGVVLALVGAHALGGRPFLDVTMLIGTGSNVVRISA